MPKSADISCVKIERAQENSIPPQSPETIVSDSHIENDDLDPSAKLANIPLGVVKIENETGEQTESCEVADIPLAQQPEELSATLSHNEIEWDQQRYDCAEGPEESSMETFLGTACKILVEACNKSNYKSDVEAFGELLKAELDQIEDSDKCQAIRFKIMQVLMNKVD